MTQQRVPCTPVVPSQTIVVAPPSEETGLVGHSPARECRRVPEPRPRTIPRRLILVLLMLVPVPSVDVGALADSASVTYFAGVRQLETPRQHRASRPPSPAPTAAAQESGETARRRPMADLKMQYTLPRLLKNRIQDSRASPSRERIESWVHILAPRYELEPELVLAVIAMESNFDPQARSPKNAHGLMQLIPATAERFGVSDINDPVENLKGGMAYLRWLMRKFEGNVELVLAGYNAGEGAVRRFGGIPPYKETQTYVTRIRKFYRKAHHPIPGAG